MPKKNKSEERTSIGKGRVREGGEEEKEGRRENRGKGGWKEGRREGRRRKKKEGGNVGPNPICNVSWAMMLTSKCHGAMDTRGALHKHTIPRLLGSVPW